MTRGGPTVVPRAEGDLVWVTALCAFSACDLGAARVVPASIPDGLGARPGDRIEVDADTQARLIAAGVAEEYVPPAPPEPIP